VEMFGVDTATIYLSMVWAVALVQVLIILYYVGFILRILFKGTNKALRCEPSCYVQAEVREDTHPLIPKQKPVDKPESVELPSHLKMN